jgi:hypothetical protein
VPKLFPEVETNLKNGARDMKSLVKSAMILCLLAITLLGPASLKLAGPDSALAADDILDFIPAMTAKKAAPVLQTPVVSDTTITLTWTFGYWGGGRPPLGAGYRLEESAAQAGPFNEIAQISGVLTPQTHSLTRTAGTYYYRVRAFYGGLNSYSPYSNVVSATVKAPVLQTPVVSGTNIPLTWTFDYWPAGRPPLGAGYRLEESAAQAGPFNEIAQISGVLTPQTHSLTRTAGTYYYRVRAFYGGLNSYSPYSNVVSATVAGPTVATLVVSVNNLLIESSVNPDPANTVYNSDLAVGTNWIFYWMAGYPDPIPWQDYVVFRTLLKFDTSSISGKTIKVATLRLYPYGELPGRATQYALQALAQTWNGNTVTHNNFTTPLIYTAFYIQVPQPTTLASPWDINVKDMVQFWADGTWNNYGFIMYDPIVQFPYATGSTVTSFEGKDWYSNINRRPQLYVEYE